MNDSMEDSNRSSNPTIHEVKRSGTAHRAARCARRGTRRVVSALPRRLRGRERHARVRSRGGTDDRFKGIAPDSGDRVVVPEGYVAQPIGAWGEPVGIAGNMPAFKIDASNTAAEQAAQMGCTTTACITSRSTAAAVAASCA
jgi:hypothetical protein